MAASIFTKLSAQSRHKNLFDEAFDPNNPPANLRHANTLGKLAAINVKVRTTCHDCGHAETHELPDLLAGHSEDTPLKDVRPPCSKCGSSKISTGIV